MTLHIIDRFRALDMPSAVEQAARSLVIACGPLESWNCAAPAVAKLAAALGLPEALRREE